ncbi:E3 ubiquitin-protein ligase PRT1-like [Gossypium arboreum]|uniref:E3 ubiquitin-protein ligase PRT1-like n=1 Tax=Gossypium arboreum TaxID=29729 RepID=UPI000819074E|nr:E3 ubiquitin-protein ligase PRT1-like [Gossypium arboreum]
MEKEEKINVNIDETLTETENEEHVEDEKERLDVNLPPEEFPNEFQCCVCLELLYKPVVLACGHMSCFWCVYNAMNHVYQSNCPICRCPFNHFPSVCQLLHFLLLKLYPIAYKRRERQVQEEENEAGRFSLQFDKNLVEPMPCENSDIFRNNQNQPHLEMDIYSESCSKDQESSSSRDSLKMTMQDENGIANKLTTSSKDPEVSRNEPNEGKSWIQNEFEHKDQKVAIADLLCAACKRLLLRPVVLNCGHVYCESCFLIPKDEILMCQVCKSLQPNGFPSVCLILEQFLEEHFPEEYTERQRTLLKEHSCSIQAQRDAKRSAASMSMDFYSSWFLGNGPKVHIGVGCDYCGMTPIIGERYRCKDCVEKIGFDLCESCYKAPAKIPGRFNQQHKPEHQLEIEQPVSLIDFLSRLTSEQSDDDISDAPGHTDNASHMPLLSASVQQDEGDGSQDPEDVSPSLILSVDVSLDQEDDSDDPNDNISSDTINQGFNPVNSCNYS